MAASMTGYGRAEQITPERKISVEVKSVNHRYLDLNIRMPRKLNPFEGQIRNLAKQYMQRGKVDIFITFEDYTLEGRSLKYNRQLAEEYMTSFGEMSESFGLENDITVSRLARFPDILVMEDESTSEEEMWAQLEGTLVEAFRRFADSRAQEGKHLQEDLLEKLDNLDALVLKIEERGPEVVAAYREKLETKVRELLSDTQIEESRIAAEVVIFADKICNDEETVRLHSHINSMRKILQSGEGLGRKLDFVAQEMNREANTILSKSGDLITSETGIELKTEIEKIREQIQNLE